MRTQTRSRMAWPFAALALCFAVPAAADVTLLAHFTFVNGDTTSGANYYSIHRARITAPDGKEFMYDSKADRLTVIDHKNKRYWTGPLALADSISERILTEHRKELAKVAEADQAAFAEKVRAFNDSIKIEQTFTQRKIAGYPATLWRMTAGSYMQHERWVARALNVVDFGPEVQKAAMASIMDPVGRVLMKMLIGLRSTEGVPLASKTTFRTLTQSGSFSFETYRILDKKIPASVWEVPKDYTPIKL